MFGIGAGHVEGVAFAAAAGLAVVEALVHPLGVVGVDVGCEDAAAEAVAHFEGHDLFVEGVGVAVVGVLRVDERGVEHRGAADEAGVEEDVVLVGQVVVDAAFDVAAQVVLLAGLGVVGVVVEAVVAPVAGVGQAAGDEGGELVAVVFQLGEDAFGHDVAVVVAEDDVAHAEFLVDEGGVVGGGVVGGRDDGAVVAVDEVLAAEQVGDDVLVQAFVVAEVDAAVEVEVFTELGGVGGQEAVPFVVVHLLAYDHLRAGGAGGVEGVDGVVVEGAVGAAEGVVDVAVGGAVPEVAVFAVTAGVAAVPLGDGGVDGGAQAGLVVDLPEVVERDLGFVVGVEVGNVGLSVAVTEGGVVLVGAVVAHVLFDALPLFDGEGVVVVALVVCLGCAEDGQRELVVVVDALGDAGEVVVAFEGGALDVAVAPGFGSEQGEGPAVFGESGGYGEEYLVVSVIAHGVGDGASFLGVGALGDDVDGASDGGDGYFGGAQSALHLHGAGDVGEAGPVGPVDFLVFHAVHGDAVDHHGHVFALEAADTGAGVAEAAAVFSDVDAGGGFEQFGELLRAELLFDEGGADVADGDGGLAVDGHAGGDGDVGQQYGVGLHAEGAELGFAVFKGVLHFLVADVGEHEGGACGDGLLEVAVDVGHAALCGAFHHDAGSDERFAGLGVDQLAAHLDVLRVGREGAHAEQG